jgi:hypothetical protein
MRSRLVGRVTLLGVLLVGALAAETLAPANASTLTLQLKNGEAVQVPDFRRARMTMVSPSNPGQYILMGSRVFCAGPECPPWPQHSPFSISYDEPKQFFTIALEEKPIWAARTKAQNFLMRELNLSKGQLCTLNYYIGTDYHTDDAHAGKNLGFSFCPFSVH